MKIGAAAADAIAQRNGTRYTPGNVVDLLCKLLLPTIEL
jgi:hypothetical protein